MSKKKEWKKLDSKDRVETFKVPKSLWEELSEENADYKLLINDILSGAKIVEEGNRAAVDLLYRVRGSTNQEAKKFWVDRVEALVKVVGLNSKMRDRLLLIEHEYKNLYALNSNLLDRIKELEAKLAVYEQI